MSIYKGEILKCDDCGNVRVLLGEIPKDWSVVYTLFRRYHYCPSCRRKSREYGMRIMGGMATKKDP